ncbi:MAG: ATP-binding protein, partial [Limisphaerales bacterium]
LEAPGLERAMVVFAMNAADAMPAGGKLIFKTHAWETAPEVCNLHGALPPPPLVSLSVADAVLGMAANTFDRVFEPFFTTKPPGKGAGLGLYSVRLFAEKHGAALSANTQPGSGTTFHLWFARADLNAARLMEADERPVRLSLLVTGGESGAREAAATQLRASGFYAAPIGFEKDALDALCSPYYQFGGMIVLAPDADESTLAFCRQGRAQNPLVRILIGVESHKPEESNTTTTVDGWTVLAFGAPNFIEQLKTALDTN